MSSIWYKVLKAINFRNLLLQKTDATLDVAADNIEGLIRDLTELRNRFPDLVRETRHVAEQMEITPEFPKLRRVSD